ncbi:phage terminase large subunit [Brevundimonas sp. NPDC058933]|uniref:phage terminase large subunit n=1 Tax=Brevundimonas sp. NPDC058933 TaxID=3346673 RepID=UPI003BEECF4B
MTESPKLNPKQIEQMNLAGGPATYCLAAGGSRSGKTAGWCHYIEQRALFVPGSVTGIFRATQNSLRRSVFRQGATYRQMSRLFNPGVLESCKINETDMTIEYENGSMVMFLGLDDGARMERVLGLEFLTIYVNEASEFPTYEPIEMLTTRLAQKIKGVNGQWARPKFLFDMNPSSSKHWTYKCWRESIHPESGDPLDDPADWDWLQMNPHDNAENLAAVYLKSLKNMSAAKQRRFVQGEWQTEVDGALFNIDLIDAKRVKTVDKNDLVRILVAVDPAAKSTPGSDETGIIVAGIDESGQGYILEDASMRGTPEQWAARVKEVYERWSADCIVYEANQGGEMVAATLRAGGVNLPIKAVWASRGKTIRAEPISALYERGQISHVGEFKKLEDQMASFTLDYNRTKQGSPDRLDALVWALTELMTIEQDKPASMEVTRARGMW